MATMRKLSYLLILLSALLAMVRSGCYRANWWSSFDREGSSTCGHITNYIQGFYRNKPGRPDGIHLLEEAECCPRTSPWEGSKPQTMIADWWLSFDQNNRWVSCPDGFFLHGLWRTGSPGFLGNIEEGRCTKPAEHPRYYQHCYNQDIMYCFDQENICKCNDGYFVTGLYRGVCQDLFCLEHLKCCKMASGPESLDSMYAVKNRIMDTTMYDLANLAHVLGYGWCAGCRSNWVGEDFYREGDNWKATVRSPCSGYMSDRRLNINYGHWKFNIKDIKYSNPVIQQLQPETIDSGSVVNADTTPVAKTITRSETSVRTVSHTKTSSWLQSHELGVEVSYTPNSVTGGFGGKASYNFKYENSQSSQDSTSHEQGKKFEISSTKTVNPMSAAKWRLILSKTRTTVSYTATVVVHFSAEFQGFLRWGGGGSSADTNYHVDYRGSGDRPTFNYRFGDDTTPFNTALRRQSEANSRPWLWNDMKNAQGNAQYFINELTNENRYVFTLTGVFEDVVGTQVDLQWEATQTTIRKRSEDADAQLDQNSDQDGQDNSTVRISYAQAGPNDPPPANPPPPQVIIDTGKDTAEPGKLVPARGD